MPRFRTARPHAARSVVAMLLILVMGVLVAGCVNFVEDPAFSQAGDVGPLALTVKVCATNSAGTGGTCGSNNGSGNARLVVAALVPVTFDGPAQVTSTLSETATVLHDDASSSLTDKVVFERNDGGAASYSATFPPTAGYRWIVYASEVVSADTAETSRLTAAFPITAVVAPNGSIAGNSFNWNVSLLEGDPSAADSSQAAVTCAATFCVKRFATDQPFSARSLAVTPPVPVTAQRAASTTVPFTVRLDGGALPSGQPLAATATSSIAGATVSVAPVTPTSGADIAAPVKLTVPVGAPAGASTVTLKLTSATGDVRTAVATVNVPELAVVTPSPTAPKAAAIETVTSCVAPKYAASVVRFTTTEPVKASYVLQRRSALPALLRKCPSAVRGGGTQKPKFSTVAQLKSFALQPGVHTVRLADLRPKVTLKPGAYRLLVRLSRGDGSPGRTVTQSIIVLAP